MSTSEEEESMLDVLNKTWAPRCTSRFANPDDDFVAFGNTPMVDLFKDLDMGKKLDVLLIQQGDMRHIMKTVGAMKYYKDGIEQKPVPDEVTFRFVDSDAASIARNTVLFRLLDTMEDKAEDYEFFWNVWFNCYLTSDDKWRLFDLMWDEDIDEEVETKKCDDMEPNKDNSEKSEKQDKVESVKNEEAESKNDCDVESKNSDAPETNNNKVDTKKDAKLESKHDEKGESCKEEIKSEKRDEAESRKINKVEFNNNDQCQSEKGVEGETNRNEQAQSKRKWKYGDKNTERKVGDIYNRYGMIKDNEHGIGREWTSKDMFTFETHSKEFPDVSRRYATKWPYKKFEKFQSEFKTWNDEGIMVVGSKSTEDDAVWPNRTMYREEDCNFFLEREACPLSAFCPIDSATMGGKSLTESCFAEFVKVVKDFKEMSEKVKVQIIFEVGDTLEYLSSHKEGTYNLIHTSNLADKYGLTSTLLVCESLLEHENSLLITTTEEHVYVPRKDYITSQIGCSVNMLPTLLGVQIAENLSLGQNFIGKDSPVQIYRWVKCSEAGPAKVSLVDSPELFGEFRKFFSVFASSDMCSSMGLATAFKRFQRRITDKPEFILDNIIKDILSKPFYKSFHLVCRMLGILTLDSLSIIEVELDAEYLEVGGYHAFEIPEEKTERFILTQQSLFSSFIADEYQTDTYYCSDRESGIITMLFEEKDYDKMWEYNIKCTSADTEDVCLSDAYTDSSITEVVESDQMRAEAQKTEQKLFVREQIESYIVTIDYKGDLVDGSPFVVYDERPCRVTVNFTDSNGNTKMPVTLNSQLTSDFHHISVDKSTRQINVTLYKECLQRMGHNLLPLSTIGFDSSKPCLNVEREARWVLNEIETREEAMPKEDPASMYEDLYLVRSTILEIVLKKRLTPTSNALLMRDISNEQLFLKTEGIYLVDGYPVVDITFNIMEDDHLKGALFMATATLNGWRFRDDIIGIEFACIFDHLKMQLLMNSKRVSQKSVMPGCYRSFLDIRVSDLDSKEIPKSIKDSILSKFSNDVSPLDYPRLYNKCCYCLKYKEFSDLVLCRHCGEALYCNENCKGVDYERHVIYGPLKIRPPGNEITRECTGCGQKTTSAKVCSGCKDAYYCDRKCQEKDWKKHKTSCKKSSKKTKDPNVKENMQGAFSQRSNGNIKFPCCSSKGGATGRSMRIGNCRFKEFRLSNNENHSHDKQDIGDFVDMRNSSAKSKKQNIGASDDMQNSSAKSKKQNIGAAGDMKKSSANSNKQNIGAGVGKTTGAKHGAKIDTNGVESVSVSSKSTANKSKSSEIVSTTIQCANCNGKSSSIITCAICSTVKYCGDRCQLTHWPTHHKQCIKHLLRKIGQQL